MPSEGRQLNQKLGPRDDKETETTLNTLQMI